MGALLGAGHRVAYVRLAVVSDAVHGQVSSLPGVPRDRRLPAEGHGLGVSGGHRPPAGR